jgi:perosamine synthetase
MVSRKITLGTLNISDLGKALVNEVLATNRLSCGKYTQTLEKEFAHQHGSTCAVFCNSGTSALQIALAALKERHGYRDGDEVLVPALTFIATSNVVLQNNLTPVFVDVDAVTYNIDPLEIEEHITPRTRCIIPVHLFGLPADMTWIMRIAERRHLQVIEDSCEAMFADCDGRRVGSFGDLACFSTYVAHLIVGGVGGIVTTNDAELETLCRSLMAHGRDSIYTNIDQDDTDDKETLHQMIERRYSFDRVGFSFRATEMEAAIAFSELERWPENIRTRRRNAEYLTWKLEDLSSKIQRPFIPAGMTHSFMMYPMVIEQGVNRDNLLMYLETHGIETRYMFPLLSQPVYRKLFPGLENKYPVAQRLSKQGFFIGMHQGLSKDDIMYVSDVIHQYFEERG